MQTPLVPIEGLRSYDSLCVDNDVCVCTLLFLSFWNNYIFLESILQAPNAIVPQFVWKHWNFLWCELLQIPSVLFRRIWVQPSHGRLSVWDGDESLKGDLGGADGKPCHLGAGLRVVNLVPSRPAFFSLDTDRAVPPTGPLSWLLSMHRVCLSSEYTLFVLMGHIHAVWKRNT